MDTSSGERKRNKATREQQEQRIYNVQNWFIQGYRKGEVKKLCKAHFGIGYRQAEAYIARAKQELVQDSKKTLEENKALAEAFYSKVLVDKNSSLFDKLRARRFLDDIQGLRAPRMVVNANTQNNFSMSSEVLIDGGGFLDQPLTPELKMIIDAMTPEARKQFESAAEKADNARLSTAG